MCLGVCLPQIWFCCSRLFGAAALFFLGRLVRSPRQNAGRAFLLSTFSAGATSDSDCERVRLCLLGSSAVGAGAGSAAGRTMVSSDGSSVGTTRSASGVTIVSSDGSSVGEAVSAAGATKVPLHGWSVRPETKSCSSRGTKSVYVSNALRTARTYLVLEVGNLCLEILDLSLSFDIGAVPVIV